MLFMTGQTMSRMGSGMSMFVLPLVTFAVTGSLVVAGVAGSAYAVGNAVVLLPAGVHVDRRDARRILILSALVGGALVFSLVVVHLSWRLTAVHVLAVSLLLGAAAGFAFPAEAAMVRRMVSKSQAGVAVAADQGRQMVVGLVAAPLGGSLLSVGLMVPFVVDSATYILAASSLAMARQQPMDPAPRERGTVRSDLRVGLRWMWSRPAMRLIVLGVNAVNFATSGLLVAVVLVLQGQRVTFTAIGLLETAAAGAGVAGAVLASVLVKRMPTGTVGIIAFWALAAVFLTISVADAYPTYVILFAAAFLVIPVVDTMLVGHQFGATPEHLQGRVSSALGFVGTCTQPLSPLLAGVALELLPRTAALAIFGGCVALAALAMTLSPHIRSIGTSER
ncbi:MFS transporter [Amycolatopsis lexingtonensis]|uniref:MFS transporter n=1 Tax=Amycolatopsis lexingtonensis TaxID=218822 RepID=UPI003F70D154